MTASVTVGEGIAKLLNAANSTDEAMATSYQVASELYGLSRFHISAGARFLTLITVLEILSGKKKRSVEELTIINRLKALVKGLSKERIAALRSGLGNLKFESIGGAIENHVTSVLGSDDGEFVTLCYRKRSKLTHGGLLNAEVEVEADCDRLDKITSALIDHAVAMRLETRQNLDTL